MSRSSALKEDPEMDEILAAQRQLVQRQKEFSEIPKRLAQELRERETTMPPLAEIAERKRRLDYEDTLSRGEAKNILRDQNRSIVMLVLLVAATGSLVWWGLKLMQG